MERLGEDGCVCGGRRYQFSARVPSVQVVLVGQEPVLFSGSVKDNIAYGLKDCEAACADDFIAEMAEGIHTGTYRSRAHPGRGRRKGGWCKSHWIQCLYCKHEDLSSISGIHSIVEKSQTVRNPNSRAAESGGDSLGSHFKPVRDFVPKTAGHCLMNSPHMYTRPQLRPLFPLYHLIG